MSESEENSFISVACSSSASLLSVVASFVVGTHRQAALLLVALATLILLGVVGTVFKRMTNKTPISLAVVGTTILGVIFLCIFGYTELKSSTSSAALPSGTQTINQKGISNTAVQQQGSNSASSTGDNSPAVAGSGNTVTYGNAPQTTTQRKRKNP